MAGRLGGQMVEHWVLQLAGLMVLTTADSMVVSLVLNLVGSLAGCWACWLVELLVDLSVAATAENLAGWSETQ